MVGAVFLSEGIQMYLFPDVRGAGRLAKIGIPFLELTGPFVGAVEIACGALVLFGLVTRVAAIPLVVTAGRDHDDAGPDPARRRLLGDGAREPQ
jgi:uncharacterized membrane protein YphA (DoxX/SURF4 family)